MSSLADTSLASRLAGQVERRMARRGERFLAGEAVRVRGSGDDRVLAVVQGPSRYDVALSFDPEAVALRVDCTCPRFADHEQACEHIWSAILAADAQGLLTATRAAPTLRLLPEAVALNRGHEAGAPPGPGAPVVLPEAGGRLLGEPPTRWRRSSVQRSAWKQELQALRDRAEAQARGGPQPLASELFYVLDVSATTSQREGLIIEIARRRRTLDGGWGTLQWGSALHGEVEQHPDAADRLILSLLAGAPKSHHHPEYGRGSAYGTGLWSVKTFTVNKAAQRALVELICRTGRCALRQSPDDADPPPIDWNDGEPWELWLQVDDTGPEYTLSGSLRRADERMGLSEPVLLAAGGVLFTGRVAARFEDFGAYPLVELLRREPQLKVPLWDGPELLVALLALPWLPRLDLPPSLGIEPVQGAPAPRLRLRPHGGRQQRLLAELSFGYQGQIVSPLERSCAVLARQERRLVRRDAAAEERAAGLLRTLAFRDTSAHVRHRGELFVVAKGRVPGAVRALLNAGWLVEAEDATYRGGGGFRLAVASGVDWFDLQAEASFGDQIVRLPELLAALRRGEGMVRLGDGTMGLLPERWLKQIGMLADLGAARRECIRFGRNQVFLLDALLASRPEVSADESFEVARRELRSFDGLRAADQPAGFTGSLRPYQRQGLGWLHFLRQFGFGGCLADDMGLGKTVQVLALLESRRAIRAECGAGAGGAPPPSRPGPALVVVPRSLVFNWKQEAARFAPLLRVLDHTGAARHRGAADVDDHDVVLTTYGTLRRDVLRLKDIHFDYVILDEAQAIKNAATQAAKAARLLRADNRLALSGTPIENHLGELWSLFEFLNPGMLGRGKIFKHVDPRNPDEESRRMLAAALRPVILRRTKDQVARDLPRKLEQTLSCDLLPGDRRRYEELRDHYRRLLLKRVDQEGLNHCRMHVLEALLRLRQAACHSGLIDKERTGEPSAKLELLLPRLEEVVEEGYKALVFSQFTSLLSIVRDRLDGRGAVYEYLDGRTRDRKARVQRFQTDPRCRLFLISLKAGGLGLNLTAAEYVFLLDPWWNPAAEAQAVDRAHRIGQAHTVFAFRLIARDTVEEKVLQLQESKRALVRDVISADDSLVRSLTREDLERLLS